MIEQALLLKLTSPHLAESTTSLLRQEYQAYQRLFQIQPALEQQYLSGQAAALSDAILRGVTRANFSLPDQVVCHPMLDCSGEAERVPVESREQRVGSLVDSLTHTGLTDALCERLSELEKSTNQAISVSAGLIRYAMAVHMIYHLLPAGRSVVYATPEDDDIPNQPVDVQIDGNSEINPERDTKTFVQGSLDGRELETPYVKAALGFYLPQWVAFDRQGNLLVNTVAEAEAYISSMQHYLAILNLAISLAPYMITDDMYLQKHYGMMGQLVNQARSLASYQVEIICQTIKRRSALHDLDRGLRLSIPYFNDQTLTMESYDFDVIPVGRVMFIPAFVVLAVRAQGAKVVQDTHLNRTTRMNLLKGLCTLERAFLR